jgi:hypothetical protein
MHELFWIFFLSLKIVFQVQNTEYYFTIGLEYFVVGSYEMIYG